MQNFELIVTVFFCINSLISRKHRSNLPWDEGICFDEIKLGLALISTDVYEDIVVNVSALARYFCYFLSIFESLIKACAFQIFNVIVYDPV